MPSYTFKNDATGEVIDAMMKIAERDDFLANNPQFKQVPCAPKLVDPYSVGRMRTSEDFNSLLKGMKTVHKDNTIQTR